MEIEDYGNRESWRSTIFGNRDRVKPISWNRDGDHENRQDRVGIEIEIMGIEIEIMGIDEIESESRSWNLDRVDQME